MSDLVDFLLARIDEQRETAQSEIDWMRERYGEDKDSGGGPGRSDAVYEYGVDRDGWLNVAPEHVLAECEAKREQIATLVDDWWTGDGGMLRDRLLGFMAVPFADHPDYRDEWKPQPSLA